MSEEEAKMSNEDLDWKRIYNDGTYREYKVKELPTGSFEFSASYHSADEDPTHESLGILSPGAKVAIEDLLFAIKEYR